MANQDPLDPLDAGREFVADLASGLQSVLRETLPEVTVRVRKDTTSRLIGAKTYQLEMAPTGEPLARVVISKSDGLFDAWLGDYHPAVGNALRSLNLKYYLIHRLVTSDSDKVVFS